MINIQLMYIQISLIIKGIYNLIILIILLMSCRNINTLKSIQKLYAIISIISWILIVITYFTKFTLIIIVKLKKKKFIHSNLIKRILLISWLITNISAYIIMIIAFVYDSYQILKGNLTKVLYECIFCSIYIIYICFSINDYYNLDNIFHITCEKIEIKNENKEEIKNSKNDEEFEFDINVLQNRIIESTNSNYIKKEKAF